MEPTNFDLPEPSSNKTVYIVAAGAVLALIAATVMLRMSRKNTPGVTVMDPVLNHDDWRASVRHLAEAFEVRLQGDEQRLDELVQTVLQLQAKFATGGAAVVPTLSDGPAMPAATSMPPPGNMPARGQEPTHVDNGEAGALTGEQPKGAAVSL